MISRDVLFYEDKAWNWTKNCPREQQVPANFGEGEDENKIEPQV